MQSQIVTAIANFFKSMETTIAPAPALASAANTVDVPLVTWKSSAEKMKDLEEKYASVDEILAPKGTSVL